MHTCDDCNQTFDSHLEKANHIRWNHKETTFTESGRQKNRETAIRVNESRWGRKITEIRRCPKCESSFEVSYREKNPDKVKKFCSRSCANSRNWHTPEARKRLSDIAKANPVWTANSGKPQSNRFSSKAERALAAELRENFRRHLQAKLDSGRRIDVDIAHKSCLFGSSQMVSSTLRKSMRATISRRVLVVTKNKESIAATMGFCFYGSETTDTQSKSRLRSFSVKSKIGMVLERL